MPETPSPSPPRKRAVAGSRTVGPKAAPRRASRKTSPEVLDNEAPARNYALQLTDALDVQAADQIVGAGSRPSTRGFRGATVASAETSARPPTDNFALRLSEALEAISAAQVDRTGGAAAADEHTSRAADTVVTDDEGDSVGNSTRRGASVGGWLATLDKLPPIRLPVGPPIPWRLGLPALVALVVLFVIVGRPSDAGRADGQGVKLPTQETYQVQQDAPLFAGSGQAQAPQPVATATAAQPQPIGVAEPAGMSFDVLDVALKLAAVLGLAYASLMLLKKAGLGGTAATGKSAQLDGMRVLSTLALAPNRAVHVIRVPGGKTLLVGATPNAVNLIADLGEPAEDETPVAAGFLNVLKGTLN